jgi:acid phosphatase
VSLHTETRQSESVLLLTQNSVHDGDIVPMLAALDLYHDNKPLPLTHVHATRAWRTSQVTPMMGRVIFEKIHCPRKEGDLEVLAGSNTRFIRININDGIVALPGCETGPGRSCPLDLFVKRLQMNQERFGDFKKVCGLGDDAPGLITFLHQ